MALVLVALPVACISHRLNPDPLPAPLSPHAAPQPGLFAGFGRTDITPPPGVGLAGYGPDAQIATGYRLRLYARALVVRDAAGELVALVVADLPLISPTLHRRVAQQLRDSAVPIGADRLIMSATHTHAGPGHFFSERAYNLEVSSLADYDPELVRYLVTHVANAVATAYRTLRPARLAWDTAQVWGQTRNRSYQAFLRNKPAWTPPSAPPSALPPEYGAVDPTWTVLRVDLQDASDKQYYPAGAFSVFAMHGTGDPSANDLLDADIQGLVERGLERHIDSLFDKQHGLTPGPPQYATRAVHLFANGTEGDVSPDWPASSRCRLPAYRPGFAPGGPRTPPPPWHWDPPPAAHVAHCLSWARLSVNAIGAALTGRVVQVFDRLGPRVTANLDVAVVLRTVSLSESAPELCESAEIGPSTMWGAEDGRTRLFGWRALGLFSLGLDGGESAVNPAPSGCQAEKAVVLGTGGAGRWIKDHLYPYKHAYADTTQLAVVRLGDLLLGAVPAEVTTVTGAMIKQAIADSARAHGLTPRAVAVVGLANGYISYVTTAAEYSAQQYEGGSDLFGPGTAAFLATRLGSVAGALAAAGRSASKSVVTPFTVYPGPYVQIVTAGGAAPRSGRSRAFIGPSCDHDTLRAIWTDPRPPSAPRDSQVLSIARQEGSGWTTVGWDDDPQVEVRLARRPVDVRVLFFPLQHRDARWEVRWARPPGGKYIVALLPRDGFPADTTVAVTCR